MSSKIIQDKKNIYRVIDANLNRAREGLRVCEDVARFILQDEKAAALFKKTRQKIFLIIKKSNISYYELLAKRDSLQDVGKTSTKSEKKRQNWQSVFEANIERVKESLRVLEEMIKILDEQLPDKFKKIRFLVYEFEKKIITKFRHLSDYKH